MRRGKGLKLFEISNFGSAFRETTILFDFTFNFAKMNKFSLLFFTISQLFKREKKFFS